MIVTYQGGECFKMQFGDMVIGVNPPAKESSIKSSRFGADIALVSLNHKDFNGVENLEFGDKKPFIISGPGEYEVKDVFIKGFKSHSSVGGEDRINTIYTLTLDNIRVCFLGAVDTKDLGAETMEALDDIDLLFVPIGGNGVLEASTAYKLAVSLEPKMIVPMHFGDVSDKALKAFVKEAGAEKSSPLDKLTIKRKDLDGKQAEVAVLAPTN